MIILLGVTWVTGVTPLFLNDFIDILAIKIGLVIIVYKFIIFNILLYII